MGDPDEQVLVVPRASIVPGDGWLGVRRDGIEAALEAVRRDGFFMRRGDAEEDPTHKQVIPYLVLRDGERWFLMRRTQGGRRRAPPRPVVDRRRRPPQPG